MSARFDSLLAQGAGGGLPPSAIADIAEEALDTAREAQALPVVRHSAEISGTDAALWQWTALLHRALDQHEEAVACFRRAAALAPTDPLIAHGLARTSLEAGLPARFLFERARSMAPGNGEVLLGLAAARCGDGQALEAEAELSVVLRSNPGWIAGHEALMQIRWMDGDRSAFHQSVEEAIAQQPLSISLWTLLLTRLIQADRFEAALAAARAARRSLGDHVVVLANEATALCELGRVKEAGEIFRKLAHVRDVSVAVRFIRNLLRSGRAEEAARRSEAWLGTPEARLVIPYLSIGWRLTGDPRWTWLEGDERLVQIFDLAELSEDLEPLANRLRLLHGHSAQMLDQSVRGGTQTDGNLFQRIDPEIRELRRIVEARIADYLARLPAPDPSHPLLGLRRDEPIRFAGAWSVRLTEGGCHASHNHPSGWISSAFYVSVPESCDTERRAGWLRFGVPQEELGLDLPPFRWVEPKPGRLVLFPSTMWHGTLPFPAGERMTVAFDVAPPRI